MNQPPSSESLVPTRSDMIFTVSGSSFAPEKYAAASSETIETSFRSDSAKVPFSIRSRISFSSESSNPISYDPLLSNFVSLATAVPDGLYQNFVSLAVSKYLSSPDFSAGKFAELPKA